MFLCSKKKTKKKKKKEHKKTGFLARSKNIFEELKTDD